MSVSSAEPSFMLRQAQHERSSQEPLTFPVTLSLSKGDERPITNSSVRKGSDIIYKRPPLSYQLSASRGIAREKQICHTDHVTLWGKLRKEFAHAFALEPEASVFAPEDLALLEKVARLIVKRGMTTPALLFLESLGPLNFLGSQVLHGLRPFLEPVCDVTEMERLAVILERRDSIPRLIAIIQEQATSST
jgi:hypothetical protein